MKLVDAVEELLTRLKAQRLLNTIEWRRKAYKGREINIEGITKEFNDWLATGDETEILNELLEGLYGWKDEASGWRYVEHKTTWTGDDTESFDNEHVFTKDGLDKYLVFTASHNSYEYMEYSPMWAVRVPVEDYIYEELDEED